MQQLSLGQTARLNYDLLLRGLSDASQYRKTIKNVQSHPVIQSNLIKSTVLQLLVLGSVLLFDSVLVPTLFSEASYTSFNGIGSTSDRSRRQTTSLYYELFFLYPLLGLSFFLQGIFNLNLASTQSLQGGEPVALPLGKSSSSGSKSLIAKALQESYRVLLIMHYLLVCFVLYRVPLLGKPACFIYMAAIGGWYCFEFQLVSKGLSLSQRVRYLEERVPYFAGFGTPLTVISFWHSNAIVNMAIFAIAFPLFLVMATQAEPRPLDPSKPLADSVLPQRGAEDHVAAAVNDNSAHLPPNATPHSSVPKRIPLLVGAVIIHDFVAKHLWPHIARKIGSNSSATHKKSAAPQTNWQPHSSNGGASYANSAAAWRSNAAPRYAAAPPGPSPPLRMQNGTSDAFAQGFASSTAGRVDIADTGAYAAARRRK
ncbi:hypothetical protein E5Q_00795 [Mixia osmundae IAM 14324]|uniref:Uncharacterized protein n=1 Tax=Mixia osmundae (strain CBS 9802 / IAM 14324 / JCM 22182 / KY 12970) TaxID=764103 RepID=G7DU87_MIXOS|nr:hypothetical protein E5Q_00795 [Mixia osmundae IAM 14324]